MNEENLLLKEDINAKETFGEIKNKYDDDQTANMAKIRTI